MGQTFNEITGATVDRFLRNILFIDDNAYPKKDEQKDYAFDACEISTVFAQKGKLCTIFAPTFENDLDNCLSLSAKSDVVVLDWRLDLKKEQQIGNEEEDADSEEPRGVYTIRLINSIIKDAGNNKLKLIIVYTGENDLNGITDSLYGEINPKDRFVRNDCRISSSNVIILIRAKYSGDNQFKYNHELQSKIVEYKSLPGFITSEFSNFVGGLLPDFAMEAITAIRDSTSSILGVFSKDIDPAFLGQYASIPDCNDAISMLPQIFGTAVTNLIENSDIHIDKWIEPWIEENIKEGATVEIGGRSIEVNADKLKRFLKPYAVFEEKFQGIFNLRGKGNVDKYKRDTAKLFCSENSDVSNYKWARLAQYSNLFSSPKTHRLTTGTIIKSVNDEFLICIQQSCDSVRIDKEEARSFLFLPLIEQGKGEAVVVEDQKHLIVDNKSYSIVLYKFSPINKEDMQILGVQQGDQYVFTDKDGRRYIWVAELKEMFAQHIVSAYVSQLSRVGIDNSEWIRLVGKTNKHN